ncbi:MAG: ThuA domain-containing protein, partial [Bryobacteraceae bacterium]
VLYVTHSAGFVHGSISTSRRVLQSAATRSGALEVVSTEDLSFLTAARLRDFDVVFFFTSGELPLDDSQKADLLAFVRGGKGFGGVHSATDTLYNWPEYGEMIGAYFDGHPWAHQVAIDVEDPDHPAMAGLAPSFRISDEIYKFRAFSRERVRVLMTLDTRSVNLQAEGVNRVDGDFALADFPLGWCRPYGQGRVFYTALGHGDETWLDPRFEKLMLNALLWLAGDASGDAAPRPAAAPVVRAVANAAGYSAEALAPGSVIAIGGTNLTGGSTLAHNGFPLPVRLAGTSVLVNGAPVPLYYASPTQINAQLPYAVATAGLAVRSGTTSSPPLTLRIEPAAPGIFAVAKIDGAVVVYATGLGAVAPPVPAGAAAPSSPPSITPDSPQVFVGDARAEVFFSGLAPGWAGLYQVNAVLPAGVTAGPVTIEIGGRRSNAVTLLP